MSNCEVFNEVEVLEEFDNDLDLLSKLLGIFRADCEKRLPELRAALGRGDLEDVSNEAHALKSGVGNFFATRAYQAASELESIAVEGSAEAATAAFPKLEAEIRELITALDALCNAT